MAIDWDALTDMPLAMPISFHSACYSTEGEMSGRSHFLLGIEIVAKKVWYGKGVVLACTLPVRGRLPSFLVTVYLEPFGWHTRVTGQGVCNHGALAWDLPCLCASGPGKSVSWHASHTALARQWGSSVWAHPITWHPFREAPSKYHQMNSSCAISMSGWKLTVRTEAGTR